MVLWGPLRARRDWLEDVIDGQDLVLPARRLAGDGITAWEQVLARGYEGLVAKDPASPYRGGRTLDGSWRAGLPDRAAVLRRRPRAPDILTRCVKPGSQSRFHRF